jgi:hypothetical protein
MATLTQAFSPTLALVVSSMGLDRFARVLDAGATETGVSHWNSRGQVSFENTRPATNAILPGIDRAGAGDLPLDQTFPRLLYELAVRLPAMREIQAVCVWLYEPVQHAIRPH